MNIFRSLSRLSSTETALYDTGKQDFVRVVRLKDEANAPETAIATSDTAACRTDDTHEDRFGAFGRSNRSGWPQSPFQDPDPPPEGPPYPDLDGIRDVIAPYFDVDFYRNSYPDVVRNGICPIRHYILYGWRERRDPSSSFSTEHYLTTHPDVTEQGINPFWHHIVRGGREGRAPAARTVRAMPSIGQHARGSSSLTGGGPAGRPGQRADRCISSLDDALDRTARSEAGQDAAASISDPGRRHAAVDRDGGRRGRSDISSQRQILRSLRTHDEISAEHRHAGAVSVLEPHALAAILSERLPAAGLVVSFSHDAYTRVTGGTQILIADEQALFATRGMLYLHLAPVLPALHLKRDLDGSNPLSATLDGETLGVTDARALADALRSLEPGLPSARFLICHCVLGHDPTDLKRAYDALRPGKSVFWVHDYSSLCEGYTLLRNDVQYCGAPPAHSQACRICVHGPGRAAHGRGVRTLFTDIPFHVVAPSEAAMSIWQSRADLPHQSLHVHPHATMSATARRRSLIRDGLHGTAEHPLRIGFVGHPASHKGWPAFLSLVGECGGDAAYRFFHFTADPHSTHGPSVETIRAQVTPNARDAMRAALESQAIDLVLVLSPWPETFSFVTYEALGAGADILALRDSGNVADVVLRSSRGVVFDTLHDLRDFMVSGLAIEYVRLCFRTGNTAGPLKHRGGTASLGLIGEL